MAIDSDRPALDIDAAGETSFSRWFNALPPAERTVRFFVRGQQDDFYSVHGADAELAARQVYKTTQVIKYGAAGNAEKGLASVTLSKTNMETFARDLLLKDGFRIELYRSDARGWTLWKKASPGNLQEVEDIVLQSGELGVSQVILAVRLAVRKDGSRVLGVAFQDGAVLQRLGVAEFVDNDVFSNLEALAVQLAAKECVVSDERTTEHDQLRAVLRRLDVAVTEVKRGFFGTGDVEGDLGRLLGDGVSVRMLPQYDWTQAMGACACLIRYLGLAADASQFGRYVLETFDLGAFMKLDPSAVRALHLLPGSNDSAASMSLFGLLNHCRTAQGSRLLQQWILQPLVSRPAIDERLDVVEALVDAAALRQTVQDEHLKVFPDLARLSKRLQRPTGSLQDVVRLYQCAARLPALALTLQSASTPAIVNTRFGAPISGCADQLAKFLELVESTVDMDALDEHQYRVKADFDEALLAVKVRLDELRGQLDAEAAAAAADLGLELGRKLKFEHTPAHGHHLRLSRADASVLRRHRQYKEIACQKAGVLFQTAALRELSDANAAAEAEYAQVQTGLAREIVGIAASYLPVLEKTNQLVAELDVFASLAHAAAFAPTPYVRPTLGEPRTAVRLTAARHPCLEAQEGVAFIANDVAMGRGDGEGGLFHIITGPNMGGKSTYIRQVGMIALMAQMGSFVPCSRAELPVFDALLARVGAGDAQLKGVSTFMAEMLETASILRTATSASLLVVDELGRGTSTYDGFGLAWAISEHLARETQCCALFATHFHELTTLASSLPTVSNYHVTALTEPDRITLLYRVSPGVCDQSFGIHVAELAQFPAEVVRLAKRKAQELEDWEQSSSRTLDGASPTSAAVFSSLSRDELDQGRALVGRFLEEYVGLPEWGDSPASGACPPEVMGSLASLCARYKAEIAASRYAQEILATLG